MFKKSIIAAATVLAVGGAVSANAAVVAYDNDDAASVYSAEGAQALASYNVPAFKVTLGAEYQVGDTVTFTFNANFLDGMVVPTPTVSQAVPGTNDIVLGFLSKTANSVTYRVTTVNKAVTTGVIVSFAAGDSTANAEAGFYLDDASVESAGKVSVTYSALTSTGVSIDQSATTNVLKDVISVVDELSTKVQAAGKLNGVIDVAQGRLKFDATTGSTDVLTIDNEAAAAVTDNAAVVTKVAYTLNGDFSWIIDNNPSTTAFDQNVVAVASVGNADTLTGLKVTPSAITFNSDGFADVTVTFTPANNHLASAVAPANVNGTMLPAGSYTVDAVVTHTVANAAVTDTTTGVAAGAWSLNGATRTVQAYPLSSAVQNFLWVTNAGSVDGAISATGVCGGESVGPYDLGMAPAKTATPIASALAAAMGSDCGSAQRAQVVVTVNSPKGDIDVNASYKVSADADRLTLSVEGN